jgi:DNA-binding Xre family transcriptional regulator
MPRFDPERLNHAIATRHLDGEQLAKLSGLHRSVVSRARQGRPIRLKTMKRISAALGAKPVDSVSAELLA